MPESMDALTWHQDTAKHSTTILSYARINYIILLNHCQYKRSIFIKITKRTTPVSNRWRIYKYSVIDFIMREDR